MGDRNTKAEGFHLGEIEDSAIELIDDETGALFSSLYIKLAELCRVVVLLTSVPRQAREVGIVIDPVIVQRRE